MSANMVKRMKRAPKRPRAAGTAVIWPRGLQLRYGVSGPTVWRWEQKKRLPPRDVFLNGQPVGWRPQTIEALERGEVAVPTTRGLPRHE